MMRPFSGLLTLSEPILRSSTQKRIKMSGTFLLVITAYFFPLSLFGQTLRSPEYPPATTQVFARGLYRRYYEGTWSQLPDFNTLTPDKTLWSDGFDLIRYNTGFNFGYHMTGFIDVKADGTYTFYTSSSDGSRLYIGNTLVVDNDGLHPMQERSGSIGLR